MGRGSSSTLIPRQPIVVPPDWLLQRVAVNDRQRIAANRNQAPYLRVAEYAILPETLRNDGLMRYAGALRRQGAGLDELVSELTKSNVVRCRPPLPHAEVFKIAESAAKYPVGGPDPLEAAWQSIPNDQPREGYDGFLALLRQLQLSRPGYSIALPLERIGWLMKRDWTQVRRWRRKAVGDGRI